MIYRLNAADLRSAVIFINYIVVFWRLISHKNDIPQNNQIPADTKSHGQ